MMEKVKKLTKKREIFFGAAILVLLILALWGFVFDRQEQPLRVAFDTKGGGVIFDHQYHVTLKGMTCQECHHNYESGDKNSAGMNCRECHYRKDLLEICDDAAIHKRCIGKNCLECHVRDSVSCDFCHNTDSFKTVAEPKDITFQTDGGPVLFNHFAHASPDEYDIECESCHHGYKTENRKKFPMNCRRCHYNSKYAHICEDADTHMRCIGKNCIECHSDGIDDCTLCHKEEDD
jgi:hypothetical protein